MGNQLVRALVPVRHDGVLRVPGQIVGANAQDFVLTDAAANRLIGLGLVSFISGAAPASSAVSGIAKNWGMGGMRTKRYAQRIMNLPAYGAFDQTTFRRIEAVPFTGKKFVRAKYENDLAAAWGGSMSLAVSGGRAFSDNNPVNAAGEGASWSVSTGIVVPQADADVANNGKYGAAWSPYMLVDLPPAVDEGIGSYLYLSSQISAGTGRGLVGGNPFNIHHWETVLSAGTTRLKARLLHQTGNFVTANQNAMNAPTLGSTYSPVVQIEFLDASDALTVMSVGDSTRGGQSSTAYNWNFMNQWADSRTGLLSPVGVVNLGFAGKSGQFYMGYLEKLLSDGSVLPDWLILQPFTANSGSEGAIQADLLRAFALAEAFEQKGTTVSMSTVGPAKNWFGASAANDAVRAYGNDMIRRSSRPFIDVDAVVTNGATPIAALRPEYTPDGNHYNDAANAAIARAAVAPIALQLFGIS